MKSEHAAAVPEPTVLFEDDDVMVISKPVGWLTHADGKTEAPTVVEWFLQKFPEAKDVGEAATDQDGAALDRSGIVHRLDRETSGVLILAKTQEAHQFLKKQFQDRSVFKEYRAFIYGRMHDRWFTMDRPIGRSPRDSRMRSAMKGAKGMLREAVTEIERIGVGEYQDETFSYVKLQPKTGRTHQLRVHLRALDRPIVGDTLYAQHLIESSSNLEMDRMALHAHILGIIIPNGSEERFIAPVPQIFDEAAERIAE
jgi:23S rRNA pseudouridine1911/1915/1917 synthase